MNFEKIGYLVIFTLVTLIVNYGLNNWGIDNWMAGVLDSRLGLEDLNKNQLALSVIRILTGLTFIVHGWGKVTGGIENWTWMGSQMQNFGFVLWGLFQLMLNLEVVSL